MQDRFTSAPGGQALLVGGRQVRVESRVCAGGQLVLVTEQQVAAPPVQRGDRNSRLAEIGRLATGLAHQLRTPLATLQLYVDLAADATHAPYAQEIQGALDSLSCQVDQLLVFAKGEILLEDTCDSRDLFEAIQRQSLFLERRHKIDIQWRDLPTPVALHCARHLLVGACVNLIDNALQASAESDGDATVTVTLKSSDGYLHLQVEDNGAGVPEAVMDRLGESFNTQRNRGNGLGLPIARLVARAHGGEMQLVRRRPTGTVARLLVRVSEPAVTNQTEAARHSHRH